MNDSSSNIKKENLWNEIVKSTTSKKDLDQSNIFIFGDKNVGKKNLIRTINKEVINKSEDSDFKPSTKEENSNSKYALIDYASLNVKKINEADSDVIGKMNIWIVNEMLKKDVFESVFRPEYILKSLCILVVDISRPHDIIDNLKKWMKFIYDNLCLLLMSKIPLDKQEELRERIENYVKLYEDPSTDEDGNLKKEILNEESIRLKKSLPLKEGLLRTNLGFPLIFVINKTDIIEKPAEKKRFDEDSEFIMKHIRNFALSYAATTIYTSTKQNLNISLLYEYILHRIYDFEFNYKPNLIDKDSYFIPSGYDSMDVLRGYDFNNDLSKLYEEKIPQVKIKSSIAKEEEIVCEDIQSFLGRLNKKTTVHNDTGTNVRSTSDRIEEIKRRTNASSRTNMIRGNSSNTDFAAFMGNNNPNTESRSRIDLPENRIIEEETKKKDSNDLMSKLEKLRKTKK